MHKTLAVCIALALVLFAAPAMATHPNFIDFVLVTDVTGEMNPDTIQSNQTANRLVDGWNGSNGMYPPDWGGEGIGQYGSQTGYHYVDNLGRGRGAWFNKTMPSPGAPVILEFDLRQVYKVNQISVWNTGSQAAENWFIEGARDVTIKYRKAPWDEWETYRDVLLAPTGGLSGTRPDDLYVRNNSNAWGTYRVTNELLSHTVDGLPIVTEPQPIREGAILDHFYYPSGQINGKNADPIIVDFTARFVRFEITSNWGKADCVAISEVRFYKDGPGMFIDVDPNPAYNWGYVHPGNNLNFGDAYRNWTKPQDILVYNLGTSAAEVQGATVEGPFGLDTEVLPVSLAAADGAVYDVVTLQAQFSPTIIGSQSGAIHIQYATAAGEFIETLNVSGTGKDVAFGYIPYVGADATQWGNPWWGGWEPKYAVNGKKTDYNSGGAYHMIEDLGDYVFGSKNAKEQAGNWETWRTDPYPQFSGVDRVEGVQFICDLGGALGAGQIIGNQAGTNQAAAVTAHDVSEIRIWNCTGVDINPDGQRECMAAVRSVKFEYSSDVDAADWQDVTDWQQWGPDIVELAQPVPDIDSPATDILDVSDIGTPIRWWRFTTLGLAAGAPGANYGRANMIGLGQIRFYTSKANVAIQPVGHDFGNLAPYESVDAPEVNIQNVGTEAVIIQSIEWDGDPGPFSMASAPSVPADLTSGQDLSGLVVNFTPILYGTYQASLGILVIDNSDPGAEEKPENYVTMVFDGSCLAMENGFIPVDHAWASTSWDGNWTPNWTHAANGAGVQEVPEGVWGSRDMLHTSVNQNRYMWHARQPGYVEFSSHWVAWDLGETKTIYDLLIWNAMRNSSDGSGRGFRKVRIQYTTDAPPDVYNDSEWGPWGGDNTVPIEYAVAWDGLNWLQLGDVVTLAHLPLINDAPESFNFSTPTGSYPASNQLNGNPIEFRGVQARVVRMVADGPTWKDYLRSGEQDVWYSGGADNYYNLAEVRFYGPTSNAVYDVAEHDFGSIPVGDSASVDITVTNLASATDDVVIEGLFIEDRSGADAASPYSLVPAEGSLPIMIAKGQSAVFTLTFAPTAAGDYNTFESVILNDSSRNGLMLTSLMGTAYEPGNPDAMLPATVIDFGERFLQLGTQGVPFTIKNMGDTALTVDFAFDPSSVFGTTQEGTLTIDPFSQADAWITVTPQSLGVTDGVMTLTTNDPDEGTIEVPLTVEVNNASAASVDGSWMLYE